MSKNLEISAGSAANEPRERKISYCFTIEPSVIKRLLDALEPRQNKSEFIREAISLHIQRAEKRKGMGETGTYL